ncbi:MAG: SH3 domain-containing protein [Chloroflexi bacterium]|nr:SH3 domain-containing protein [Ardenticatenaceae bacterium]NOG32961.1 SH3 domain-containing protein [Chloroflexota bacterium]GIK54740.1 MAG: hypothetical protein BroJett015_04030 [Chloroflexota bacterium]
MRTKLASGKLWIIALMLLAGLFLTSQVLAYDTPAQLTAPAIVNANSATVHANADAQASIVDVVSLNQVVTLIGRNADASWVFVRTPNNILGWMRPQVLTYTINLFDLTAVSTTPVPTVTPLPGTATATPTPISLANATGIVNTGALNVRSGPGVQYNVIAAVYFGDVVTLLGRNGDATWLYIQTAAAVRGWVNARYITPSVAVTSLPVIDSSVSTPVPGIPTSTPVGATTTPTPVGPTAVPNTATINTSSLNMRSGPGVGYVRVATIDSGQLVWLWGRNLDTTWVQVARADNVQGWVNGRFLVTSSSLSNLPVTSQSGTGTVVAGNLNVRSTPGVSGSVVTVASYGSAATLLGRTSDNAWLYIRASDGQEGWVNAGYISTGLNVGLLPSLAGPVPGQPIAPAPPVAPPPVNPGNTASLRACPNLTCQITGTVYSGLAVTATGRTADNTWVYVVLSNGQEGWIQAQFVALGVPITTLPIRQ